MDGSKSDLICDASSPPAAVAVFIAGLNTSPTGISSMTMSGFKEGTFNLRRSQNSASISSLHEVQQSSLRDQNNCFKVMASCFSTILQRVGQRTMIAVSTLAKNRLLSSLDAKNC